MRWIILTFLLSCPGLRAAEPSNVALGFLRDLAKEKSLDGIPEELALSPFCGPGKRKVIEASWKRRFSWLQRGGYEFSEGREKVDGDLAGVLIVAKSATAPESVSVLSLALKQHEGLWQVTPVEGKFANANVGFSPEIKSRAANLETWIAAERVGLIEEARNAAFKSFSDSIAGSVDAEKLKTDDPEDVLNHFLDATTNGRVNEVMVWLGALDRDELPEIDWESTLKLIRRGMRNEDSQDVWRVLTSTKVMKVIVEGSGDDESASYMIGFLSSERVNGSYENTTPVRFEMKMTKGGWRIILPNFFSHADESENVHSRAHRNGFDWEDNELVKQMGGVFEEDNDQLLAADPATLMATLAKDLEKGHLNGFLQRHFRELDQDELNLEDGEDAAEEEDAGEDADPADENQDEGEEDEAEAEEEEVDPALLNVPPQFGGRAPADRIEERRIGRYHEAIRWWEFVLGKTDRAKVSVQKVYQDEKIALGILRVNRDNSPEPVFRKVWMTKEAEGWVIVPGVVEPFANSIHPDQAFAGRKLSRQYNSESSEMKEEALRVLLAPLALFDPAGQASGKEPALALVKEWRKTLLEGSLSELFEKAALIELPKKPSLFVTDMASLRSGASMAINPDQVLGAKVEGRIAGVSLLIDDGHAKSFSSPVVFVVPTQEGLRVLADVELSLETNKAKRLRNEAILEELEEKMAPVDFTSLKKLLEWHQGVAQSAWDAHESSSDPK